MGLFFLKGAVEHYQWGGTEFIPRLLGIEPTGEPFAEYWLGAHDLHPSMVIYKNQEIPLPAYLQNHPDALPTTFTKHFSTLPFMVKVLDVKDMLSIQVHPRKENAQKGYERENQEGKPLTAAGRTYKDANHKPEAALALSPFWLLHGLKSKEELLQALTLHPVFEPLYALCMKDGYTALIKHILNLHPKEAQYILTPLLEELMPLYEENQLRKTDPDFWVARAVYTGVGYVEVEREDYPDPSLLLIYLMNIVNLKPGEYIFQESGVLHAYLEGQVLEPQAASDNVLRAGLTKKHKDIAGLLENAHLLPQTPHVAKGSTQEATVYPSNAREFITTKITLQGGQHQEEAVYPHIVIVMEGVGEAVGKTERLPLKRGDAFIALGGERYTLKGSLTAYKTTVNIA